MVGQMIGVLNLKKLISLRRLATERIKLASIDSLNRFDIKCT